MGARITINIFDEDDGALNGLSELESKNLCIQYSSIEGYGHALQSNYEEPDKKYYKQLELCKQIIKLSRELNEVNRWN